MMGMERSRPKAYYLDRCVWFFGSKLEADMDKAEQSTKNAKMKRSARIGVFNSVMSHDENFKPVKRFKDPAVRL